MGWHRVWSIPQDTFVGDLGGVTPAPVSSAASSCCIRLQSAKAEPATLSRQIAQPLPQRVVIPPCRLVTDHSAADAKQCTRPALDHFVQFPGVGDGTRLAPGLTSLMLKRWLRRPWGYYGIVEHCLGQQLLQPQFLHLERLQPPRLGHVWSANFRLLVIERGGTDLVTAAHLRYRAARLRLLQHRDDLLFIEPASLRCHLTAWRRPLPANDHISADYVSPRIGFFRLAAESAQLSDYPKPIKIIAVFRWRNSSVGR